MIDSIKKLWQEKPLLVITLLAVSVRLISVIFATGYGYHDDHFLVIRPAQTWLEGFDMNHMITETEDGKISGRSILYPGIHYALFAVLEFFGMTSPLSKMFVVRLLHALFFVVGIRWAYRLSLLLTNEKNARAIGLILALFWMFPHMSVRSLVEVTPIPLMLLASVYLVRYDREPHTLRFIWFAGILLGLCFSLRYQTIFFTGGIGLILLLTGRWKEMIWLAAATIVPIALIHGIGDYFICDFPFCKIWYYVEYNIIYSNSYFTEPWFFYVAILLGVFVPPVSFFLFFGFIRSRKVNFAIWAGTLCFLIFHSIFPNKQERFIFTIMPHILIFGYIGWQQFVAKSSFWQKYKKLEVACWVVFWLFNFFLLSIYSTYANKEARTAGMTYLRERGDVRNFVMIDPKVKSIKPAPMFYLGKQRPYLELNSEISVDQLSEELQVLPDSLYPNYLIIMQKQGTDIKETEEIARLVFPEISYLKTTKMSEIDAFRYRLNKHLKLDDWVIYQIEGDRNVPFVGSKSISDD